MEARKSIGMELRALNNLVKRKRRELLPDCMQKPSFPMMHGHIIAYLYLSQDKDIFQRDIEQEFEIRRPTVTKVLQSMEKNGLVTRHEADHDARLKKIRLTEEALRLHGVAVERVGDFEMTLTKGLTEEEIEFFLTIVGKIKKNLE